jgi:hypothetical protein
MLRNKIPTQEKRVPSVLGLVAYPWNPSTEQGDLKFEASLGYI